MRDKPDAVVNGRHRDDVNAEVNGECRPKSRTKMTGRSKQDVRDEATGRRMSRGRQVAERLVTKLSSAAAIAAAWRRPSDTGSNSELASAADDSGFASSARRVGSAVASPDQATSDAGSSSTTAMSSPVDWLDVDRVAVSRVPGAVGIINHHNTCFINAIVQCLSNTPAFVVHAVNPVIRPRHYSNDIVSSTTSRDGQLIRSQLTRHGELGNELSRLLRAMWTGRYSTDRSRAFHRAVRRLASGWYGREEQNDAHEFAAWLLNRLRDEQFGVSDVDGCPSSLAVGNVKQTRKDVIAAGGDILQRVSVVDQLFSATCRSTLVCPGCACQSDKLEPFLFVSLPIPTSATSTSSPIGRGKTTSRRPMLTVYVTIVRRTNHEAAVRHGFQLASSKRSTVAKLKRLISDRTGIPRHQLVLVEVVKHELHVTLHDSQTISNVCNMNGCVYAFEMSSTSARDHSTSADDVVNIIALSCDSKKARRLGRPVVFPLCRDVSFDELVAALLTNQSDALREDEQSTSLGGAPFLIRLVDGPDDASPYLNSDIHHPLISPAVQQALLSCSEGYGPAHVKLTLDWKTTTYRRLTTRSRRHVVDDVSVDQVIKNQEQQQQQAAVTTTTTTTKLTDCFMSFTQQERLEDDNTWYCSRCQQQQLGTIKKLTLSSLPDILIVHLKRFKQEVCGTRTKLESLIEFPVDEGLDLSAFVDANNNHRCLAVRQDISPSNSQASVENSCSESHVYDLCAVCSHSGSLQSGHYTATCRSPVSEAWYLFDDHVVTQVGAKTVVTKDAYMLFYQRRCERNSAATAHLRSSVTAPSGDTSLTSLANSSLDNTLCDDSETCNTTHDNHSHSHDSSFQSASSSSRRPRHRVSFVDHAADLSWRSSSSVSRRPPLPPGTVDRRRSRPPSRGHLLVTDTRGRHHLHQLARHRVKRSRSWHSLTTPVTSERSANMTHDSLQPSTDIAPPKTTTTDVLTSPGGGKFRFLSQLFAKKSPRSLPSSSPTVEHRSSLRPALRGAADSNLSRSAPAGKITDGARPARTVRWDISPDMDKTVAIPTWKRPKKAFVQESSV